MKVGLVADVRGLLQPLRHGLAILQEEGCERIACLGSTVEGGEEDEAVLRALGEISAMIVPSPHDAAGRLDGWPPAAELAGLSLAHETPDGADETLWLTGCPAPSLLRTMETLRRSPGRHACGDLYVPLVTMLPDAGAAARRIFIGPGSMRVPDGSFIACPGSLTSSLESRHGGAVMTWDDSIRELSVVTFGPEGQRLPPHRPSVLVYCEAFDAHAPDPAVIEGVRFNVLASADDIRTDVDDLQPDVIVMDYHLAGTMSGIDALISLRKDRDRLPAPVVSMAGDPSESGGMKAAGAVSALPYVYLKDTLTRLIVELTG